MGEASECACTHVLCGSALCTTQTASTITHPRPRRRPPSLQSQTPRCPAQRRSSSPLLAAAVPSKRCCRHTQQCAEAEPTSLVYTHTHTHISRAVDGSYWWPSAWSDAATTAPPNRSITQFGAQRPASSNSKYQVTAAPPATHPFRSLLLEGLARAAQTADQVRQPWPVMTGAGQAARQQRTNQSARITPWITPVPPSLPGHARSLHIHKTMYRAVGKTACLPVCLPTCPT